MKNIILKYLKESDKRPEFQEDIFYLIISGYIKYLKNMNIHNPEIAMQNFRSTINQIYNYLDNTPILQPDYFSEKINFKIKNGDSIVSELVLKIKYEKKVKAINIGFSQLAEFVIDYFPKIDTNLTFSTFFIKHLPKEHWYHSKIKSDSNTLKIKAPTIGLFCRLVNESKLIVKGFDENVADYCTRICKKFSLVYSDKVRQNFGFESTEKNLNNVRALIFPNIDNKDSNTIIEHLNNNKKLYG